MNRSRLQPCLLLLTVVLLTACGSPAGGGITTPVQGTGAPVYNTAPTNPPSPTSGTAVVQPSPTTANAAAPTTAAVAQPTASLAAATPLILQATATSPAAAAAGQSVAISYPYRLSAMTDNNVWSTTGQILGDVEHLLVSRDGQILYALLDTEDTLGLGDRSIVIPWSAFKPSLTQGSFAQEQLVLTTADSALRAAPALTVDADDFNFATPNWDRDVLAYWQTQNVTIPVTGAAPAGAPILLDGDVDVNGRLGEDWGSLDEFLVDPATNTIRFGLLETDDDMAVGERTIPVPWRLIQWVGNDDATLANVSREVLLAAPSLPNLFSLNLTNGFDPAWDAYWQER